VVNRQAITLFSLTLLPFASGRSEDRFEKLKIVDKYLINIYKKNDLFMPAFLPISAFEQTLTV
jgi:hypothetical protein